MTKIEWTDATWNPVTGCTKISPGCKNCYAERMARRLAGRVGYPEVPHHFDVTLHHDRLDQPLRWRKPRRVFVCSMSDLFHDAVPYQFIDDVFRKIALADHVQGKAGRERHTWQILTKRPERMHHYMARGCFNGSGDRTFGWPLPNVWIGVTAEDQKRADERIPLLLKTPAAVRFVSVEPMLGPVVLHPYSIGGLITVDPIDWVIIGCESGPGRRPMKLEWAIDLVSQCKATGVACFVKQIEIDGKVSHDLADWPKELRVREYPDSRPAPPQDVGEKMQHNATHASATSPHSPPRPGAE